MTLAFLAGAPEKENGVKDGEVGMGIGNAQVGRSANCCLFRSDNGQRVQAVECGY